MICAVVGVMLGLLLVMHGQSMQAPGSPDEEDALVASSLRMQDGTAMVRYSRFAASQGIAHQRLPDPQKAISKWRAELAEINAQLAGGDRLQRQAVETLEALSLNGNIFAMRKLGDILSDPARGFLDPERAYVWLTVSEALGLASSAPLRHAIARDHPQADLASAQLVAQRVLKTVTTNIKRSTHD